MARTATTARTNRPVARSRTKLLAAVLVALPLHASAALGEGLDSVERDRQALGAQVHAVQVGPRYTVHSADSAGLQLREYVSPAGIVFAVAWNGMGHPDLDVLLGSHSGEFHRSAATTPRHPGRRLHEVRTSRLVVQRWGVLRDHRGRAFDPTLVPAGVALDEIR